MKILIAVAFVLGFFALIGAWFAGSYVSAYNYGNAAENQIVASHKNLNNILGQYSTKVAEIAQVPGMYKDDVKETVTAALEGRYGTDGSKAVFQMLKEQNPTLDSKLYLKIQQVIDGGREEFKNQQTIFIDVKRGYTTNLGYLFRGFFLKLAGYPKIDLTKYDTVTSDYANEAFKSGVAQPLKLR